MANNEDEGGGFFKTVSDATKALLTVFGRSPRQAEVMKGTDQSPQEKPYYDPEGSLESRIAQMFTGATDLQYDRHSKYRDYDRMDQQSVECQTALDIYAEEASQKDSKTGQKIWIECEQDKALQEMLNAMLARIGLEDRIYGIYRNLAKYGDVFMYLRLGPYGVSSMHFVHPSRVTRVQEDGLQGFQSHELSSKLPQDNAKGLFRPWDFCYDDKTEILTKRGWILFKDLIKSDVVATRNKNKEFQWQKPTNYINAPYEGPMINFHSNRLDLLVTPNHRMLVATSTLKTPLPETIMPASELLEAKKHSSKAHHKIPMTSSWKGTRITKVTFLPQKVEIAKTSKLGKKFKQIQNNQKSLVMSGDDYCAFMGAYLAEGCLDYSKGSVRIAQLKKSKGYKAYSELFSRICDGKAKYNGKVFQIHRTCMLSFLADFGYSHEKYIPDEIMNAPVDQLRIFWNYYVLGDGWFTAEHKTSRKNSLPKPCSISTSSKRMADQLMEIAQKLGFCASMRTFSGEKNKNVAGYHCNTRENYRITGRYAEHATFHAKEVQYKGTVHCVTVPNGVVYVRRNGKPAWSGNCHFRILAYDQESVYGRSFLESLRKTYKSYQMLQSMIILYRIARAVQRNVFYIDVGQASIGDVAKLTEQYQKFLKQKNSYIDPKTKDFKTDFDPAIFIQDIVWPVRSKGNARVEPLYNNSPIGPLEDLDHYRNQMRTGLGIPKDYFDGEYGGTWNSKEALMLQDVRFSRKIQKLQDSVRTPIVKLCQIHYSIVTGKVLDPNAFRVCMGTISDVAERQKEDVLLRKAQIIEILGNFAINMGLNRRVWVSYIFDEIFPLPAKLRTKLITPDPVDLENVAKDLLLQKASHDGPNKPRHLATADNVKKGFRTFGYGNGNEEVDMSDPVSVANALMEEAEAIREEESNGILDEVNAMIKLHKDVTTEQTKTVFARVEGLLKEDADDLLREVEVIKGIPRSAVSDKWLYELGIPPNLLEKDKTYDDPSDYKPGDGVL